MSICEPRGHRAEPEPSFLGFFLIGVTSRAEPSRAEPSRAELGSVSPLHWPWKLCNECYSEDINSQRQDEIVWFFCNLCFFSTNVKLKNVYDNFNYDWEKGDKIIIFNRLHFYITWYLKQSITYACFEKEFMIESQNIHQFFTCKLHVMPSMFERKN